MIKKQIGKIGEELACKFLVNNGFEIINRNYQKSIGEIDIVAFKKGILHFFEIKTVSRETFSNNYVDKYRPEDNVTHEKVNKIEKTANIFLSEKGFGDEYIQIDLLTVYLMKNTLDKEVVDLNKIRHLIKYYPNINFI